MLSLEKSERGAEPAGEIVDEERVPIWTGLGEGGRDDACGRVPQHLPPPQGPEHVLEGERIDHRGEEGALHPHLHQLALRRLLPPGVLGHSIALAHLGRHGG